MLFRSDKLHKHLQDSNGYFQDGLIGNVENAVFDEQLCRYILEGMMANADKEKGGFGQAPKFPQTFSIRYLLMYGHFKKDVQAVDHALFSLKCMMRGGIFDQIGGGFCRYSTDDDWLAPHFEKMLYDNALMVTVLAEAFMISKDPDFAQCIRKIGRAHV